MKVYGRLCRPCTFPNSKLGISGKPAVLEESLTVTTTLMTIDVRVILYPTGLLLASSNILFQKFLCNNSL